jgi:glutamate-5-semialdehyde dehydrogenase
MLRPMSESVREICVQARLSARALAPTSTEHKNRALTALAARLDESVELIQRENERDLAAGREKGLSAAMLDRLTLNAPRIRSLAAAVREIVALEDPVGEVVSKTVRSNGLVVQRVRVPIGVIGMVYEARPNVTVEAAALAFKAGNAIVLRGGSEAIHTNVVLEGLVRGSIGDAGLPPRAVQLIADVDRKTVGELITQTETVDLVIPRGGESLIRFVTEHSRVPVVQHYKGVCHMLLTEGAVPAESARIVLDAKLQRPGVCNALECLLVTEAEAEALLPVVLGALMAGGCEIRGCPRARALVPGIALATDADYGQEFLDKILAVRVVPDLDAALAHIAQYGSGHTEAIITTNDAFAARFRSHVDAACVVVNASTRFHDGGELGLGAEIGIATSRLHWRGPMGLESLTTMKWVVQGAGQVRG